MAPIVFFSYARDDIDPYLEDFFKDLSAEIAGYTQWGPEDDEVSFRDKNNLRLMENWKSHIVGALQSSSVMVCITSAKYFNSEFCGKEYYLFDQRRQQGISPQSDAPAVILPVIWLPVLGGTPAYLNAMQQVPQNVADLYRELGLRRIKRFHPEIYWQCVVAFADSIIRAWQKYKIPRLPNVREFSEIPNKFATEEWEPAADRNGWLPGPEVANFVFAAGSDQDFPNPAGRYGARASEWRPYLPPHPETILHHAKRAGRSYKFREIRIDQNLKQNLLDAKGRKNLTVFLADPDGFTCESLAPMKALDDAWWEGTALIVPSNNPALKWEDQSIQQAFGAAFPVLSQIQTPNIKALVSSASDLELSIEMALNDLRTAVTKSQTDKKEDTDAAPAGVTPVPAAGLR